MIWVGWREQRTETLIAVGILALLAVILLPTGIQIANAYHHDGIGACLGAHPSFGCDNVVQSFRDRFSSISGLLGWLTLLPGLIGVLLAAPFIAQLESGAYRLDWTQSITRRRWIASKLGLAAGVTIVISLLFIAFITWWRAPLVHVTGRMDNAVFDSEGLGPVGYALFALALALAVGVVWRRAVPALVVSFVAYFAGRLFVDLWLRQRLTTPLSVNWRAGKGDPSVLNHAWVITQSVTAIGAPPKNCGPTQKACFLGNAQFHALYEPASRFWSMQLVEFGLFAGVAIVLLAFAAWWTDRRV